MRPDKDAKKPTNRCNRGTCKGLMQERGFGKDRYYVCCICGHLRYAHPNDQRQYEEAEELCKMRNAVDL